ncbi:MAG: hypothetical protein SGBAC_012899, partial [Bacillariaceae sp.]
MSDDDSETQMKPQSWSRHPQNKSRKSRENSRSTSRRRRSSIHETKDPPSSHSSKRRSDKSRRSVTQSRNPVSRRKRVESNTTSSRSTFSSRRLESTSEELKPAKPVSTGALIWPEHRSEDFDIEHIKGSRILERKQQLPSRMTLSKDSELELSNLESSEKKTGAKHRSKSVDEIGVLGEAMDERLKAKEKCVRSRKSQPSSDRNMKYALKIGYLSFSDSDDNSDDGSLLVDIMDQRSKAKENSFRHRSKSNDRNRKRRTRSPQPSIQSVPGAYYSNGNSASQRRRPDKGGEGERAKDVAASLRSDNNSAAAVSGKSRRSGLLLGAHVSCSDGEMAKPSKREHGISLELEAHVAEEENPEVEAIKAENERLRREMTAENRRLRQQMTNHNDDQDRRQSSGDISQAEIVVATATDYSDKRAGEKKRKQKRYFLGLLFCFLILLGVTGGAVVTTTSESSDFGIATTDTPSTGPSGVSSISPTITMLYAPPSEEDCRSVQDGEVVGGQEAMIDSSFVVDFEVFLNGDVERSEWLQELLERLTIYLIPYLVGCYDEGLLPITSNRYIFGNANATGYDDPETCERETELACYAVAVNLDLSLKGNTQVSSLVTLLETLIGSDGSGNSLTVRLGLSENFNYVSLAGVSTPSPIAMSGSSVPSLSPSQLLSSVPTWSPVQGQTTSRPTPPPALRPTITARPNPAAISSDPTQSPTEIQTLSPTPGLTLIPTLSPTRNPVATTSPPTPAPTSNPTGRPTSTPTPPPTFTPTPGPSPNPTPDPTPPPTPGPTPNPTPGSTQSVPLNDDPDQETSKPRERRLKGRTSTQGNHSLDLAADEYSKAKEKRFRESIRKRLSLEDFPDNNQVNQVDGKPRRARSVDTSLNELAGCNGESAKAREKTYRLRASANSLEDTDGRNRHNHSSSDGSLRDSKRKTRTTPRVADTSIPPGAYAFTGSEARVERHPKRRSADPDSIGRTTANYPNGKRRSRQAEEENTIAESIADLPGAHAVSLDGEEFRGSALRPRSSEMLHLLDPELGGVSPRSRALGIDMSGSLTSTEDDIDVDPVAMELEAVTVGEEDPEVEAIKAENERLRLEMAAENERLRQQMTNPNDQDVTGGEIIEATPAEVSDDKAKKRKKRKRAMFAGLF